MRAAIIGIGDELVSGEIPNTNAAFVSAALGRCGVEVGYHLVVPDDIAAVADALREALDRVDAVIMTGGLGPTHDDITREAIAAFLGVGIKRREDLEAELRLRLAAAGRPALEASLRQAGQPEGAVPIPNALGSAPGVYVELAGKKVFALPGVPAEMEAMLDSFVLPGLAGAGGGAGVVRVIRTAGVSEAEVAQLLDGLIPQSPRVSILSSQGEVRIVLRGAGSSGLEARAQVDPAAERIRAALGTAVFGEGTDTLEGVVVGMLASRALTLALAESVTGGLVASRVVSVPGASVVLKAGWVAYSNEAKVRDLGVDAGILARRGAVSEEAAAAMAEGARSRGGCDVGLATTGEAGPGAAGAPLGEVHLALSWEGGTLTRRLRLSGGREAIRRRASQAALNELRLWLAGTR